MPKPACSQASNVRGADRRRESIVILYARPPVHAGRATLRDYLRRQNVGGCYDAGCVSAASVAWLPPVASQ